MAEFFNFFLYMLSSSVSWLFSIPLTSDFTVGDMAVALMIMGILLAALVGQLRTFSLSHEAAGTKQARLKRWKMYDRYRRMSGL